MAFMHIAVTVYGGDLGAWGETRKRNGEKEHNLFFFISKHSTGWGPFGSSLADVMSDESAPWYV